MRENTAIGTGVVVGRGTAVENEVRIGDRCKVGAGCFICAFSEVSDDCFIAPEVTFTNDNFLGRTEATKTEFKEPTLRTGARIGANAAILPGRTLHPDALAAAGAVVTYDLPGREIHAGVPARLSGQVPSEQFFTAREAFSVPFPDEFRHLNFTYIM